MVQTRMTFPNRLKMLLDQKERHPPFLVAPELGPESERFAVQSELAGAHGLRQPRYDPETLIQVFEGLYKNSTNSKRINEEHLAERLAMRMGTIKNEE